MKLYTYDKAPNPIRLAMFLRFKGIELETQQINLMKLEQFEESYRAINPECSVPTLELDDGTALIDVVAICLYLESKYPDKPLMGRTDLERAQVIGWMHRIFLNGFLAVAEILRNQNPAFKDRAIPGPEPVEQLAGLVERGHQRLATFFKNMDEYLANRNYVVGDSLTQADLDVLASCDFALWVKVTVPDECKNLSAYLERVRSAVA